MVDTKVPTIILYANMEIGGGNMARKYVMRSKEEKLSIVKRNLSGEAACSLAVNAELKMQENAEEIM